jgi:preprotein translocase subunit SecD
MLKIKLIGIVLLTVFCGFVIYKVPINKGLDLQGGMQLTLEAKDTKLVKADADAIKGIMAVIRSRIDKLGLTEPIINRKGVRQIVVELPGVKDSNHAVQLIGDTALLEFVEAEWALPDAATLSSENIEILAGKNAKLSYIFAKDSNGQIIKKTPIFLKSCVLTGADLKSASPGTDQYGKPVVHIEFTNEGSKKFREITARNVGKPLAIVLDGIIISAPNINEPITGGSAQISGEFSVEEIRDLVIKLKAGSLPVPVKIVSNKVIGPTLGQDSVEKSKIAAVVGFVLVCAYMIFWYRLPGIMSCLGLISYILICLTVFKLCNATLTLPGIAGLILTMGIAVDANVIIFEWVREEKERGKTLKEAITFGFKEGLRTILDANVTALMAALVLFFLGNGPIRGFAMTLGIGIVVSMFTGLFITRVLIDIVINYIQKENSVSTKG